MKKKVFLDMEVGINVTIKVPCDFDVSATDLDEEIKMFNKKFNCETTN